MAKQAARDHVAHQCQVDMLGFDQMYRLVDISLFESPAQTLVNTVNTAGVMGKGVALEFKKRYPQMFQRYADFCRTGEIGIGKLYLYRAPNKWVLNFPTKMDWRRPSKLEFLEKGLKKFVESYASQGITSISFPQLGCGNGGLTWSDVAPLMHSYLAPLPIPVFVHVKQGNENFVPEHLDLADELMQPRQQVTYRQFLDDLLHAAGWSRTRDEHAEGDSPDVLVRIEGRDHQVPGEDLEDFWDLLRTRGALDEDELPSSLRPFCSQFLDAVLNLQYVRPVRFRDGSQTSRGVRYAPRPAPDQIAHSTQPADDS